jgi:hypothetical protein
MATPLAGTESAAGALSRVHYTHDAMIDLLIQNPKISQNDLAKTFGYSVAWVSRIMNSDAFNARLAERKSELVDPSILHTLEERFKALASTSMDILAEKLAAGRNPDLALKALDLTTKALGYGARNTGVNLQQNFVVAIPSKAASPQAWAEKYSGSSLEAGKETAIPVEILEASPDLVRLVEAA